MTKLSVVVPCFNEEAVIDSFDVEIRRVLDALPVDYEVCYVDDGSCDGTLRKLRKIAAEHGEQTRFVSFSRNFGKEAGMLAGLRASTGDAVVIMDADLQHPPELIATMLEHHRQGHDQIIARRTREGDKRLRSVLSRLYYRGVNRWVDVELTDGVGDFRMLSRPAVDALLSLPEYNRFSKGLFSWIGFDTVHFDYRNARREAGETKWKFGALLNYGMDGLISFNNRPLRTGIWLGVSLVALTAVYALWITVAAMTNGVESPGYVTLVAIIVGLGGVHMIMLGLIGEYIGRIYYETKRRPHFLVKEAHGSDPVPHVALTAEPGRSGPVAGAAAAPHNAERSTG
ncbi:glycosyltransferase family 2 protein [Streptomyces antarcticus]|uniref:glycosyltransferase family 2 protein n=1 Tax=Streptomyces antarcticus TaxID=2996458 RepID=UPI0022714C01|nr:MULTISPECIES: glycosyltransferase family 2 protein [unclassified Streptomyces]MCY0944369.1 glycosyltransferase family 2 protein [Streptomyces sp. H34-AA3]MCY0948826.1 glycosyltransferase family 2 protein [Streptomyces sp. H27-S2]MCZ4082955.1 glycosyltransferase family 2 protein [Streptomyces sp. H34-S5]